jgi:hypothetical protein
MTLDISRLKLVRTSRAYDNDPSSVDPSTLVEHAYEWFDALKEWEKDETFDRAFQDNRMTLRLLNAEVTRSANDFQRDVDAWTAVKADGTFKKTGGQQSVFLSGGLKGLSDRADPSNFVRRNATRDRDPAGQSAKNRLGLHDLSARLLDRRFDIGKQGFNMDKTKHAVFMPVPKQEDHVLFYWLNYLSKNVEELRSYGPYVNAVQFIRARMTRVKLAEPTDMGANLIAMTDSATGRTRIRYGYTGTVTRTVTAPKPKLTFQEELALKSKNLRPVDTTTEYVSVPLTPRQVQSRITSAWAYKSILQTANQLGNNEIAIAYRTHGSPLFPLITTWPDRDQGDGTYTVTDGYARGAVVHDDGTLTGI